ncbi:MAG TPA: ATP12 family protein [Methylocella sp.]|jgi:chaperone required for assembly of F1-ATPase|nr:ATP12 family protein [Methylocella sp.]
MLEKTSPDTRLDQSLARPTAAIDPIAMARRDLNKVLPRRFYKEVTVQQRDGACLLLLDGRAAESPGGNRLTLPCLAAARALADEWSAQTEFIDLASMPLTRIVNSAIDGVACQLEATVDEIARYAGADLVCYRAPEPEALTLAQATAWDPILVFARKKLGAHFICTESVVFFEQPEPARAAVKEAIAHIANSGQGAPFALAALHVMTTLTGSVLLVLAVAYRELTPTEAWIAAHVDEDFAMRDWGEDADALQRRARQWREMEAAARLFHAVHGAGA